MIEHIHKEKISVIIPIYNVEDYLERCLNTVCGQLYKNLEIILIDDGSTDNSLQICKESAKREDRIKVIHQSNQGVSSARNMGLDVATGNYIAFVDPDDYIHLDMYERLYSLLKKYNADMSACFSRGCWDSNYAEPPRDDIEISVYDKVGAIKTVFDPKYEINGVGVVVSNKLFKKNLFNNLRFNTQYRRAEDEQIICFLLKRVNKYVITDERLYYYFNRPNSILHSKSTDVQNIKEHLDMLNIYVERLALFREDEFDDIYNICLLNMMNLTITSFFNMNDNKIKKSLVKSYRDQFNEFRKRIFSELTTKDKIRFFTFKIFPQMYILILFASRKNQSSNV
ncbi:Glycosyl transferase family 2 [Bacillus sp. 491mf]|uniref:glycosyltransferase n=1 Tax=Bacillus TaxID=1386 RepID=UPI00068A849E|nr:MULTISPECIES: glycosyltransferase [unclassified Bacillus (in: firmicutes)]SFC94026.1 Glycosyl transferase family 2 [Bacillus sp. 491mf]